MPDKVGQQIGNYRLVRLLGSGGFADVYLGEHVHMRKQAAIKILHLFDVDVLEFQKEANTTEKLVHPRIIRLLDFAFEQGTPFLVLDYAPGGALRARHPRGTQLPLDTVVGYLKEITPALQYAHDQNTLHRDIKPGNMLIGRQGELLLSDFGIAVLSQTGRTSLQNYTVGGTPFYMAPEQYQGYPEKASDQYSLAVVVYEWLCGTVPFREGNFIQLGFQHTYVPVPPMREIIPAVPSEVEAVVMRALAKDPKQRFGSVQEFSTAFEQACIPPPQPAPSVTEPARPQSIPDTPAVQAPQEKVVSQQGVRPESNRPLLFRRLQPITQVLANPRNMLLLALVMFVILAGVIAAVVVHQRANPYGGGGTLALNDPLSDNSLGYGWDNASGNGGNCQFTGGTYHVSSSNTNLLYECFETTDFSNFTFEVQMQIIQGDCGGILFRGDKATGKGYVFRVCTNGSWSLFLYVAFTATNNKTLDSNTSSAINTGLNASNTIAVVANGSTLDLYVNNQKIASVTDSSYSQGTIALIAYSINNPAEVVYSNARAWTF